MSIVGRGVPRTDLLERVEPTRVSHSSESWVCIIARCRPHRTHTPIGFSEKSWPKHGSIIHSPTQPISNFASRFFPSHASPPQPTALHTQSSGCLAGAFECFDFEFSVPALAAPVAPGGLQPRDAPHVSRDAVAGMSNATSLRSPFVSPSFETPH